MPRNDDPRAPWNYPGRQDDPRELWNHSGHSEDPRAPWNRPESYNENNMKRYERDHGYGYHGDDKEDW